MLLLIQASLLLGLIITSTGVLGPYQGGYYPTNGDIATDFLGSSIDGIWELIIVDAFINDIGTFFSFEIDFCLKDGIVCSTCDSRAGDFSTTEIAFCRNDSLRLDTLYTFNNFDSTAYQDGFLVYSEDTLRQFSEVPDFSMLPDGDYMVYGVNTFIQDIDSVHQGSYITSRTDMDR